MNKVLTSFFKTLVWDKSNFKFALGVWIGLSFSIAVILSTVGLMDGFVSSMRQGLRQSNGDIHFYSRGGFFELKDFKKDALKQLGAVDLTGYIESQAFVVFNDMSKGVAIKGIDPKSFSKMSELKINLKDGGVIIGDTLAEKLSVKKNDSLVVVLAKGNKDLEELPLLKRFRVDGVVDHGIYQKDLRFIYMDREQLADMLGVGNKVNAYAFNVEVDESISFSEKDQHIDDLLFNVEEILGIDFRVKPYWYDFSSLLEAVEIEKVTIGIILQIIVVISIFNVLSFITFLNERKSREIFLFQSLGLSANKLRKTWFSMVIFLWLFSCLFSLVFVDIFDLALAKLSLFQLPGDVYYLGRLSLSIDPFSYALVFTSVLVWLLLIVAVALYRINKKPILYGLRKEFS